MKSVTQKPSDEKEFVSGLVIGAILGATLTIVLSKEEGKEIRKNLKKQGLKLLADIPKLKEDIEEAILER